VTSRLDGENAVALIRLLIEATRQREPHIDAAWATHLEAVELNAAREIVEATPDEEFSKGIRYAVWPVFAAVVS
jgi:hypothetical protein